MKEAGYLPVIASQIFAGHQMSARGFERNHLLARLNLFVNRGGKSCKALAIFPFDKEDGSIRDGGKRQFGAWAELVQKMGLVRYTSKSITDPRRFLREVEEARKKGYAIDDEEYLLGVRAAAAPIQTTSPPPAAIWVVGFTSSLNDQKIEKVILEIHKTAHEISHSMKRHLG